MKRSLPYTLALLVLLSAEAWSQDQASQAGPARSGGAGEEVRRDDVGRGDGRHLHRYHQGRHGLEAGEVHAGRGEEAQGQPVAVQRPHSVRGKGRHRAASPGSGMGRRYADHHAHQEADPALRHVHLAGLDLRRPLRRLLVGRRPRRSPVRQDHADRTPKPRPTGSKSPRHRCYFAIVLGSGTPERMCGAGSGGMGPCASRRGTCTRWRRADGLGIARTRGRRWCSGSAWSCRPSSRACSRSWAARRSARRECPGSGAGTRRSASPRPPWSTASAWRSPSASCSTSSCADKLVCTAPYIFTVFVGL